MGVYLGEDAVSVLGGIPNRFSWKYIASKSFDVSTSSTTATSIGTITTDSSLFTADKIIYIRVRDKAGKQNSAFYGTDNFFIITNAKNGSTTAQSTLSRVTYRVGSAGSYSAYSGAYGVYADSINSSGTITMYSRYNSSYSFAIDGTYVCDVYTLECPFTLLE